MILLVVKARYRTFERRDRQTTNLSVDYPPSTRRVATHLLIHVPSVRRSAILRRS